MIITGIRCNMPTFKPVNFEPGFNVVLADRTRESTRRDSRNGLGKTTLIEIIHFCLGSQPRRNQGLSMSRLREWSFTLDVNIGGRNLSVTRNTDNPSRVSVAGDIEDISGPRDLITGTVTLRTNEWTSQLGELYFELRSKDSYPKYSPTFRSLISYFIRRGRDSYSSPFIHYRSQREWDKQVSNAFLLGLEWQHASRFQELKDEENTLNGLRRAAHEGLLAGMIGTLGNLEAERARLDIDIRRQSENLDNFRVHPQYREIEQEANNLTQSIHQLSNANIADGRLLDLYHISIEDDQGPETEEVLEVYQIIGVTMPELVRRRLDDVREFHRQLLSNRYAYLQSEIQRIESNINQRNIQIQLESERREQLMDVLRTHGALQEYTRLHELHLSLVSRRNDIESRIANLIRFEQGRSEVRVKRELLLQTARREFEERREIREKAINIFNSNSEALYSAAGNLVVDVANTGYKFDVEIMRSGSQGIENMKIFCYDLMLTQLWATRRSFPGLLIHDSTIFDGVDERQMAHALELARDESEHLGFQYICTLNSDTLPMGDFSPGFHLESHVRLRLTDESEEGGLLGIRY